MVLPQALYDTQRRKKRLIPDISTWVQVYSTYMLVLAAHSPEQALELIAYKLLIVWHSQKFEYPSWLQYDSEYRQWAAANQCRSWSQIHPQIYAYAFTAHGKASTWCPTCQVDGGSHTFDCPRFLPPNACPSPLLIPPRQPPLNKSHPPPPTRPRPDYCILYNKNHGSCPYRDCKYTHRCAYCNQTGHPVSSCPKKA